ncbi:MAG TPA: hypothetical protein VFS63_07550 [Pseudolabrys sp.]|jgi:hypothetical protein|nr:hypothetical protein [Pseudolabrys sp.]
MKRLGLSLLGATAALVISTSAQAAPDFRVIKWDITGMCQIYDFGFGGRPIPSAYRILTPPLPSFGAAMRAKEFLWHRGRCTI